MLCRDSMGISDFSVYQLWTCSMCYFFLFQPDPHLTPNGPNASTLISRKGSVYPEGTVILPDIDDRLAVDQVCQSLTGSECSQWTSCCRAARQCCYNQNVSPNRSKNALEKSGIRSEYYGKTYGHAEKGCPGTWDGYGCWNSTLAGTRVQITCPSYIPRSGPAGMSVANMRYTL